MSYREYPPSPELAPFVACYWTRPSVRGAEVRVLPDGCMDFIFDRGAGTPRAALVVGTMTRPLLASGAASWVGVRFRPARARAFIGVPAHELTDRRVELETVLPESRGWIERIGNERTALGRVRALDRLLAAALPRAGPLDPRLVGAVAAIESAGGNVRVGALASSLGVSRQHLKRLFERDVGTGVKTFARVLRMQRVAERIAAGAGLARCAEVALEAGYFDQAHLVNDFRSLTGATPKAWARSISPRRSGPRSATVST